MTVSEKQKIVIVIGGNASDGQSLQNVEAYNAGQDKWTLIDCSRTLPVQVRYCSNGLFVCFILMRSENHFLFTAIFLNSGLNDSKYEYLNHWASHNSNEWRKNTHPENKLLNWLHWYSKQTKQFGKRNSLQLDEDEIKNGSIQKTKNKQSIWRIFLSQLQEKSVLCLRSESQRKARNSKKKLKFLIVGDGFGYNKRICVGHLGSKISKFLNTSKNCQNVFFKTLDFFCDSLLLQVHKNGQHYQVFQVCEQN